ncbi:MAG: hypothetical protein ACXQTR_01905 [Candidatus Methanospirareceae archaeon]
MPKTAKQRRGEIIHALRGQKLITQSKLITPSDLRAAMETTGVECATTRRDYEEAMETLGYIERTAGGWELTDESKQDGIITIRVQPIQNKIAVMKGIAAALKQFEPLVTMEIEA